MSMKIQYNELAEVEETGNRVETTSTAVTIDDAQIDDLTKVLRDHAGLETTVKITFKEPK